MNRNYFKEFCNCNDYVEDLRDNCEKVVNDFIKNNWNKNLEFYVECEDISILSIMVCGEIDRKSFEQFIITPLCELWDLNVSYVEFVESQESYIEWGLRYSKMADGESRCCRIVNEVGVCENGMMMGVNNGIL